MAVVEYEYDADNNKISETDEKGVKTEYEYHTVWNKPVEIRQGDAV